MKRIFGGQCEGCSLSAPFFYARILQKLLLEVRSEVWKRFVLGKLCQDVALRIEHLRSTANKYSQDILGWAPH